MTQTVLITGCSSGFGETTAALFAAKGWNVIATMREPAAFLNLRNRALASLDNVQIARLDVQDRESIAAAVAGGIARFGRIDALINNAGFGLFGIFESTPREKIAEQFDVNVFGVMDATRALLPHFRANGGGTIVNISSGAGVFTLPMLSMYCASKFALEGFSEALSYELLSQNITVKIVEPGGVISTGFGERSGKEAAAADHAAIDDYADFFAHTQEVFAGLRGQRLASEQDVAEVIYAATTDGTPRLRYVATEDIKPLVQARRESSEQEYIDLMRGRFMK